MRMSFGGSIRFSRLDRNLQSDLHESPAGGTPRSRDRLRELSLFRPTPNAGPIRYKEIYRGKRCFIEAQITFIKSGSEPAFVGYGVAGSFPLPATGKNAFTWPSSMTCKRFPTRSGSYR